MSYLLDINTLIYFFRGQGNVAQALWQHSPQDIFLSAIVLFELEVGIAKSTVPEKRQAQLAELTTLLTILPFGRAEAKTAAFIRVTLEQQGTPIGSHDVLIAATAIASFGSIWVLKGKANFDNWQGMIPAAGLALLAVLFVVGTVSFLMNERKTD